MLVRFVGQTQRVNSFGVFNPGKEYDVSAEVGVQLLSAPNLFVEVDAPMAMAKTASQQVLEVSDEISENKYQGLTIGKLMPILQERGLVTRRGARKGELIKLLEEDDKQKEAKDDGDTKTEDIFDPED